MAEQSIHEMNVGNQLALDALRRIGSSITGGINQLNQPPTEVVPNTYSLRLPATQSAVLPRGQGSALAQQNPKTTGLRSYPGNLPLDKPMSYVAGPNGDISTVRTMGIHTDKGETLIPTVSRDGRLLTNDQAIAQYKASGENFGSYPTINAANEAGKTIHNIQAGLLNDPQVKRLIPGMSLSADKTTYTQGTPGQDGYARMVVTPAQQGLRTAVTVQTPEGMTFSGTAADAQKFMEPVGRVDYNSPQYQDFVARNRAKEAVNPALTTPVTYSVAPTPPVFGGTGGWKTDVAKYQADMQAYIAAINEQGALARESLRAVAGQQPAPESQSQIALRNMQTKEAEARAGLLSEQTKTAAEQQKWVTLTEEVPTFDPASGTTVMKKKQYLYNPATKEIVRPGEAAGTGATQDAAAKRAAFAATYITKDLQKKWESMSDSEKDAAMDVITKAAAKK